ncbi:receptor-type tyrosine-protein phosphatase eta-like [Sardina pilchardus]|uniref:receptor-type tyrosine-protein phosphatase eta-like n=1 Tax=Sardina pilchardus TaxID=27697 RepID=UPI002E151FC8
MGETNRCVEWSGGESVVWFPVLVIILLGLLAAMGVFVLRRKPTLLRAISVKKFPDHFSRLSRDENREFLVEYLQFSTVGADLTQHEATLPDNKSKNRFTDILPYDCSRVKLSRRGQNSDYINANFIPGYGGKKMEYIAAQGPLSSTVSDFWRMIWEQKSERIVMVTNCVESGKAKCDQYWPSSQCYYGDLLITMTSERKDTNWTIRELIVKKEAKSEERRVKHFHFTAWPDHGVPNGTEELIQFRGLIRQHIDSSPSSGHTVVHSSAGVGRTGTLIALDVLLQQMEREQAVDIAGFVHRMRRHRPRMVQTESQYIFLHQCIKDFLTQKKPEEPLYVNTWEEPFGLWTEAEVNVTGIGSQLVWRTDVKIAGLEPSQTYKVSVTSLSGALRGPTQWISCHTTSATVIWVPELVIMLLGLLTSMGSF